MFSYNYYGVTKYYITKCKNSHHVRSKWVIGEYKITLLFIVIIIIIIISITIINVIVITDLIQYKYLLYVYKSR